MKKSFGAILIVVLSLLGGIFSIAYVKRKTKISSVAQSPSKSMDTVAAPQKSKAQDRIVFYASVGASSPNDVDKDADRGSYNSNANDQENGERRAHKIISRYTIEVAQLTTQSDAENLLLRLKAKGIEGFYTPVRRGPEIIYKVRLGIFSNPDEAQRTLSKIAIASKIKGEISQLQ